MNSSAPTQAEFLKAATRRYNLARELTLWLMHSEDSPGQLQRFSASAKRHSKPVDFKAPEDMPEPGSLEENKLQDQLVTFLEYVLEEMPQGPVQEAGDNMGQLSQAVDHFLDPSGNGS